MDENFFDQMDQELTGWGDPRARLQVALENDELTLYCQPIRALTGAQDFPMAEVLIRMRSYSIRSCPAVGATIAERYSGCAPRRRQNGPPGVGQFNRCADDDHANGPLILAR